MFRVVFHRPEVEAFCKHWDTLEDDIARKAFIEERAARVATVAEVNLLLFVVEIQIDDMCRLWKPIRPGK